MARKKKRAQPQSADEQEHEEEEEVNHEGKPPFQMLKISYSWIMHGFHLWLIYFYASTVLLCDKDQCWTVQTWVHFTWILQAFFYSVSYLGQWYPEVERQLILSFLFPIHGALWMTLFFVPSNLTANSLAERTDLYVPFAQINGTWWSIFLSLPLFYFFCMTKYTAFSLMFNDWQREILESEKPELKWCALCYQLFSVLVLPIFWHFILSPAGLAGDRTDWYWPSTMWYSVLALFCAGFFNGILVFLTLVLTVTYQTKTVWLKYYSEGLIIMESLGKSRHPIIGVVQ